MVSFLHIPLAQASRTSPKIKFNSQDLPLNKDPSPLYIPTQTNGNIVTSVLVDPMSQVNVITKYYFFINIFHRKEYEKLKATL